MLLKSGARLRSAVCTTEVIVIRAPSGDVDVTCGGAPMVALEQQPTPGGAGATATARGTTIGKRYTDEHADIELLCTKSGDGDLACAGSPLVLKGVKPLPASD